MEIGPAAKIAAIATEVKILTLNIRQNETT
jgi:hypothetical protein